MKLFWRRLRGAVGNAVVWGLSWFAGAWTWVLGLQLLGWVPDYYTWPFGLLIAANIGLTGFFAGGAFSGFLGLAYRGRALRNINVGWFALGGAAIAAICSPVLTTIARSGFGMGLPGDLVTGGLMAALFGAVTAGTTIGLAQRASRYLAAGAAAELESEQSEALALLAGEAV